MKKNRHQRMREKLKDAIHRELENGADINDPRRLAKENDRLVDRLIHGDWA